MGLHFHASWLKSKKEFREELGKFIDEMLGKNDVFFVTMLQVIQWMQNPTEVNALRDFQDWKGKRNQNHIKIVQRNLIIIFSFIQQISVM